MSERERGSESGSGNDSVRVAVGAGSPEGVNSAYVLPDRGVVVDPGPPTDEAWTALRNGISRAGIAIEAVEHVLVTHWHVDHAGLACRLADRADATVSLHAGDAPLVGSYAEARDRRLARDRRTLERWGVPEPTRERVLDRDTPSPIPDAYPVTALEDGETIAGVECVHTPGHTKGHASFATDETLFMGDVLLPTYTPNVGGSDTRLDDPLATYLASLARVETVATERTGEPGHGTTMAVSAAAETARSHHRQRAEAAFDAVLETDAPTAWDVARRLFGEMRGVHAKFGAGEAAAHLDRLVAVGIVERDDDGGDGAARRYYAAVNDYPSGLNLTP